MLSTRHWILIVMLGIPGSLIGCSVRESDVPRTPDPDSEVRGTVSYRERMALPEDATVEIRLIDASRQDIASDVIAETTIQTAGKQVPITLVLPYDASRIHPAHTYAIRATISSGGEMLFTTETVQEVITGGHPVEVELWLKRVASE